MIETYRGEALAWEADELGHMNMRYYFARAEQARAVFLAKLQLPGAFKADALSTLVPTRQHIHYHKEFRPGRGMVVRTGVLNLGADDIELVHLIDHAATQEEPAVTAATIVEKLSHISVRTQIGFAWPQRVREGISPYQTAMPQEAMARNLNLDEALARPSVDEADALGLAAIGRGAFLVGECDAQGFVLPSAIVGRISDSVQHLKTAWPDLDFTSDDGMSGALLEACARHKNRPKAGDLYIIYSGLRAANTHVRELCHWVLDPVTGECWSTFAGVGCRFNLKTRRLVKVGPETLTLLEAGIVKGLKP